MNNWFNQVNQWVNKRSLRALQDAYNRAMTIKSIEDQYFEGKKISPDAERGKSVYDYFQSTLERELLQIRLALTQVRVSNFINPSTQKNEVATDTQATEVLETLGLIESVIGKYRINPEDLEVPSLPPSSLPLSSSSPPPISPSSSSRFFEIPQKITPEYEQQVIQQLRSLRQQKTIAFRYLALLLIVPLLVQIVTKQFIYEPLLNKIAVERAVQSVRKDPNFRVNAELAEQYLSEFSALKETIEIKSLLGILPILSQEQKQEMLKEQAKDLLQETIEQSWDGIKNVIADITALGAFALLVYIGRRQFTIMRQYFSRSFLGLNDITKVFIFILLTDMFVGFHSPEGWEVILGKTFEHFGFAENPVFINLFIATVPVIMDSVFKLLIFNYFTRKSPSAVAILEKMNQ